MNINGLLVHANPERISDVAEQLAALAGVEVHEMTKDGRFVVTVEDVDGSRTRATRFSKFTRWTACFPPRWCSTTGKRMRARIRPPLGNEIEEQGRWVIPHRDVTS